MELLCASKPSMNKTNWISSPNLCIFAISDIKQEFPMIKSLVGKYSPVLQTAFTTESTTLQAQTYTMQHIEPKTFELFHEWITTRNIILEDRLNTELRTELRRHLPLLWCLGAELQIPALQNTAIDALFVL